MTIYEAVLIAIVAGLVYALPGVWRAMWLIKHDDEIDGLFTILSVVVLLSVAWFPLRHFYEEVKEEIKDGR